MLKPNHLCPGDVVGVIAPAGPPDLKQLQQGVRYLKSLGLQVCLGQTVRLKKGYLSGTDEERLSDLHYMFQNPQIKAVFCARGGYGTARIAEQVNYELIRCHPKIFWGYSDITYLHTAIRQYSGLITFHGPMIASEWTETDIISFRQLFTPVEIVYTSAVSSLQVIKPGRANGRIVGGNLTLLTDSLGTPFEIQTAGNILFMEEVDEPLYRIDAMLNHLRLAGKFSSVAGIALGEFTTDKQDEAQYHSELNDLFVHYFHNCAVPVVQGFSMGHGQPNFGFPLGARAVMNTCFPLLSIEPGIS
ncbi:LD-carboxypeptidase [Halobacillus rhizosphaerae]|uniref:S66 peptidase family protein n=1 Tax=Halobacillus rhizosphaerae TaxID=3064889 RepID=UPI00398A6708